MPRIESHLLLRGHRAPSKPGRNLLRVCWLVVLETGKLPGGSMDRSPWLGLLCDASNCPTLLVGACREQEAAWLQGKLFSALEIKFDSVLCGQALQRRGRHGRGAVFCCPWFAWPCSMRASSQPGTLAADSCPTSDSRLGRRLLASWLCSCCTTG